MEPRRSWILNLALLSFALSSFVESSGDFSTGLLDDLLRDYGFGEIDRRHRTGALFRVPLPANFSGMEAYVARFRSGSFWTRGANFSAVDIPPRVIPMPSVTRLAIVYQNLGNWSSSYYNVPGYTFVTPVVGFLTYDASNRSVMLDLSLTENPISIRFTNVSLPKGMNSTVKCVRLDAGGSVNLSDSIYPNVCLTRNQGHFSLVVPSVESPPPAPAPEKSKKKGRDWKVWVIAFGGGFGGLVLLGFLGFAIYKLAKKKKMKAMENESYQGEALGSVWIGRSKMPSAPAIRTQPVLENDNAP